jgi:D-alanyl-D-alanine dipeptidase
MSRRLVAGLFAASVIASAIAACAPALAPAPAPRPAPATAPTPSVPAASPAAPARGPGVAPDTPAPDAVAESLLVDVATLDTTVRVEIRYATPYNFTGAVLPGYGAARALLRREAAQALARVQRRLAADSLGLKIFDAYRPYGITEKMWSPKNVGFVADPAKGSKHNRGAAVDLTVINSSSGQELEMPSAYDEFTDRAHRDYMAAPPQALANRAKLEEIMKRHGFEPLPTEWWHFDFGGWERFELMNVPLEVLEARDHR